MDNIMKKPGIYMAYPTTSKLKPTYLGSETKVNNEHTNVGKTKKSFKERSKDYCRTFDKEVKFIPLAVITDRGKLDDAASCILADLKRHHFRTVGNTIKWFCSNDHQRIKDIVKQSLSTNKIKPDDEWKEYEPIDCS